MRYKYFNVFVVAFSVKFFTFLLYKHAHLIAKSGLGLIGPEDCHDEEGGPQPWVGNHWPTRDIKDGGGCEGPTCMGEVALKAGARRASSTTWFYESDLAFAEHQQQWL